MMVRSSKRTSEAEISEAVLRILAKEPGGAATFPTLIAKIPFQMNLTTIDLKMSKTREGESLWEQRVRNIRCHVKSPNNYISQGYLVGIKGGLKITSLGLKKIGIPTK